MGVCKYVYVRCIYVGLSVYFNMLNIKMINEKVTGLVTLEELSFSYRLMGPLGHEVGC